MDTVKNELEVLERYKMAYEKNPTPAMERIIEKQKKRVIETISTNRPKTKLTPTEMKEVETLQLYPTEPAKLVEYKLTPSEMPAVVETVMKGEKVPKKRGDLPRLRKNVMADIERLSRTVGINLNSLGRMRRQAETGREATVLKLAKELMDKYEPKYDAMMKKRGPK